MDKIIKDAVKKSDSDRYVKRFKTKGIISVTKAPIKLKALFLIINIFFH